MNELELEIKALQDELSLANDNGDVVRASELEAEIDELQSRYTRLKQGK